MRYAWFLVAALLAVGCGKSSETSSASEAPAAAPAGEAARGAAAGGGGGAAAGGAPSAAATEARQLFGTVCATCHGATGRGDGPASASLTPKPRDYTDKAWQATVTDADLRKIILEGGLALGKSPIMPAQPQLAEKPATLDELVKLIRSFAR